MLKCIQWKLHTIKVESTDLAKKKKKKKKKKNTQKKKTKKKKTFDEMFHHFKARPFFHTDADRFDHTLCYIQLSLSRLCLSQITAYLEVKVWSLSKHESQIGDKSSWKRGEIAPKEQFFLFSRYFQNISLQESNYSRTSMARTSLGP